MLVDPEDALPSSEVIQRVVEELNTGRLDFLEKFFEQKKNLERRLRDRPANKSIQTDADGIIVGTRGANAEKRGSYRLNSFVICIIEFWTDDELPLWLMTESAAVAAVNYKLRDETISQANFHKIVLRLNLHRLRWAPACTVVLEKGTTGSRLKNLGFKKAIRSLMDR